MGLATKALKAEMIATETYPVLVRQNLISESRVSVQS